jgi:hypothetical protein
VTSAFPAAVARAGLGAVDESDGSSTVTFPAPSSTEPFTVSRSIWDQAEGAARGALSDAGAAVRERAEDALADAGAAVRERAGDAVQAATSALPGARTSGAGDADRAFEDFYDRLKRELLIEQEQLGQLFHES